MPKFWMTWICNSTLDTKYHMKESIKHMLEIIVHLLHKPYTLRYVWLTFHTHCFERKEWKWESKAYYNNYL